MNANARLKQLNNALNDLYVERNETDVVTGPKLVTMTTTLRCNYRCRMCYQKSYQGEMDWAIAEALSEVLPTAQTVQLFGGEPLMYRRIHDLLALAGGAGCDIEVISNGSLLDSPMRAALLEHRASLVKVSMEAADAETYKAIRGGDLNLVLDNIEALARERDAAGSARPSLQINFVAMRSNIDQLPRLVRMVGERGVDRLLVLYMNCQRLENLTRDSLFLHQDHSDRRMAEAMEAGREAGVEVQVPGFFSEAMERDLAPDIDRTCHSPWKNCLVDMQGNVNMCCGGAGKLGNLLETPFEELWHGQRVTRFRRLVNTPDQPECCRTCRVKARNHRDPAFHRLAPEVTAA